MTVTYVCGHKSPDTDSVLSALVYSQFLKRTYPGRSIIPIAAGPISSQTNFILYRFGVAPPEVKIDITPTLAQIYVSPTLCVLYGDDPLSRAFDEFHKKQHSTFPVVSGETYLGILYIAHLVGVFTRPERESELKTIAASISSICKAVKGKRIGKLYCEDIINDYNIAVNTLDLEGLKNLTRKWTEMDWKSYIFPMADNIEIIKFLIYQKAGIIVLSTAKDITRADNICRISEREKYFNRSDSCVDFAELNRLATDAERSDNSIMAADSFVYEDEIEEDDRLYDIYKLFVGGETVLITTELSVASAVLLLKYSTPIKFYLKRDKLSYMYGSYTLDQLKSRFLQNPKLHSVAIVDDNKRFLNFLTAYDLNHLEAIHLILVDHNELGYQVNGSHATGVKIVEIIDHHKVAVETRHYTVKLTVRPLGCTCTVLSYLFRSKGFEPTPLYASLMLSAIMTDTLVLRSPTTTDADRLAVKYLESLSGIDHYVWGKEIFEAVEGFSGSNKEKTIRGDYKKFESKLGVYGVSQVEVGSLESLNQQTLTEIRQALAAIKQADECFMTCCLVTDVTKGVSVLFTDAPGGIKEVIGFYSWRELGWAYDMPGIVSRKKQLMPLLIKVVQQLE